MSGHRPARTRLIAASILGIVAALAAFVVMITVRYRDGLEQRLRTDLTSGASPLSAARTPLAFKSVIGSLAAEGISVDLAGVTAKGGTLLAIPGEALLTVHELIPVGGRDVPATLTGSRAGIDRQVRSLEVTEAVGAAIALALLAALARVLVLLDRAVSEARASEAAMRTSWPSPHTSSARQSPRFRRPPSGSCEISRRGRCATRSKPNSRVTAVASGT